MPTTHQIFVADQYGQRAQEYLTSQVHAQGADLDHIEAAVLAHADARVLDLGCGGGHVTYRVAPHVREVVAVDLSESMLALVADTAKARGFANVSVRRAAVEQLPFADGAFDVVLSRFSAHHWSDFEAGLNEARRVLKPGGLAVFADAASPGNPLLDTHLQALELLRDPTHVRNYSVAEWRGAATRAGFTLRAVETDALRLVFDVWVARTATSNVRIAALRALQVDAPDEVQHAFHIEPDGSFLLPTAIFDVV